MSFLPFLFLGEPIGAGAPDGIARREPNLCVADGNVRAGGQAGLHTTRMTNRNALSMKNLMVLTQLVALRHTRCDSPPGRHAHAVTFLA